MNSITEDYEMWIIFDLININKCVCIDIHTDVNRW